MTCIVVINGVEYPAGPNAIANHVHLYLTNPDACITSPFQQMCHGIAETLRELEEEKKVQDREKFLAWLTEWNEKQEQDRIAREERRPMYHLVKMFRKEKA